jgi:hypothetical protein
VAFVAISREAETEASGREGLQILFLSKRIRLLAINMDIVITCRRPVYTDPILSLHRILRAAIED